MEQTAAAGAMLAVHAEDDDTVIPIYLMHVTVHEDVDAHPRGARQRPTGLRVGGILPHYAYFTAEDYRIPTGGRPTGSCPGRRDLQHAEILEWANGVIDAIFADVPAALPPTAG